MKKMSILLLAVCFLFAVDSRSSQAQSLSYQSCKELKKAFPQGIAKNRKVAAKTKARISTRLYRQNRKLDINKNGIVCDKREPKVNSKTFGSGTKIVGPKGIPVGRYISTNAKNCYWARLSGFGGTIEEMTICWARVKR